MPDWFDISVAPHERTFDHGFRLDSLAHEWERELAALWRLEADVNNGAYLQFLTNWGYESYVYASQALKKIGAHQMAEIIDDCQTLVDEHVDARTATRKQLESLMPNEVIDPHADNYRGWKSILGWFRSRRSRHVVKEAGSALPENVLQRIFDLSYEFMDYPDDIAALGMRHYARYFDDEIEG